MKIDIRDATVSLSGRFTFAQHDAFQRVMSHLEATPASEASLDLSGLEFIDSAGLGMLLMARDVARDRDLRLTLRGAHGPVARMLDLACFDNLFMVEQ